MVTLWPGVHCGHVGDVGHPVGNQKGDDEVVITRMAKTGEILVGYSFHYPCITSCKHFVHSSQ